MNRRLVISTFIIFQVLVLAGCNLPSVGVPATETAPPDLVFTAAAETIEAQLSSTVPPATTQSPVTVTPVAVGSTPSPTTEPTSTSTPTTASTPTEIPEIIFFDDFSDTTGWYTFEDDRFGFKYTADGYHIYNNVRMGLIWSIREQEFSSIALEVDGTRLEGPDDSYFGVVCKFSDEGDNYYALVVADNGFYGLGLMEEGEYDFIETGMDDTGMINTGRGETNRIRGICNDDHFMIYVNGGLLLDVWDDTLQEGIIGLVVGNQRSGSGAEFRFNDFAITWP